MDTGIHAAKTALRIVAGVLFWQHGAQKLFGWLGGVGADGGTAELVSIYGLAGILEFFGGILFALGLLVRPVAVVLALEMLVAYAWRHVPQGFWPIENGGELALLYLFIFVFYAATHPSRYSLDRLRLGETAAGALGWAPGPVWGSRSLGWRRRESSRRDPAR